MEHRLLARVVEELSAVISGSRVDKVIVVRIDSPVLLLRGGRKNYYLLLSPERALPRLHLLSRKPESTVSSSPFYLSLKKHLTGRRLTGIRQINGDRVVEMKFAGLDEETVLVLELLGASGNLILTDGRGRIIAVHRPVPPGDNVPRPLVPGIGYEPPLQRRPVDGRAGDDSGQSVPRGEPSPLAANAEAEAKYERLIAEREIASLRQTLAKAVRQARERVERRSQALQHDLASAEKCDDYRRAGELILMHLQLLHRGQDAADLPDIDGTMRHIALEPSRSPAENAGRYFKRYRKAKAGFAVLRERLSAAQEEMAFLESTRADLDGVADREALHAARNALAKRGLIRDRPGRKTGPAAASAPYRTISYEGWNILIGRSAAGNDYVTMHLARPDDLWLHAEGVPGSHVLVANPGKRDIPPAVLKRAASLAAYHSKAKASSKVSIAYTPAKYVRKPKGAAPGMVVLRERRSIVVAPEEE